MATTAVEIVVPDGLGAGDEFSVEWGGVSYSIAVPDGMIGGQALTIELPALEETPTAESAQQTQAVEIMVPDGLGAGDEFSVEWGGVSYNIAVPDGVVGGQALTIELPALQESAETDAAEPAPAEVCSEDDGYKFKPGQRIEVYRTDGSMSPGHIVGKGWEGFDGPTYKAPSPAPRCRAPDAAPRPRPSPRPARGHRRTFPCTTAAQVQLDDGLCKEAVPEDEISDQVRGRVPLPR
jgi:hypothetical protein